MRNEWDELSVITNIIKSYEAGEKLSYSYMEKNSPSLLRAAERIFGTWAKAVQASGIDYNTIRKYKTWDRNKIIDRIIELNNQGVDLNWRNVSEKADPGLAAAALRKGRFKSWNDALTCAGLNPDDVCKYQRWDNDRISDELQWLSDQGVNLDQNSLLREAPALLAAIYRINGSLTDARINANITSEEKEEALV
ncbi:MAG: hypothetical protein WCO98_09095 [bacterium]